MKWSKIAIPKTFNTLDFSTVQRITPSGNYIYKSKHTSLSKTLSLVHNGAAIEKAHSASLVDASEIDSR